MIRTLLAALFCVVTLAPMPARAECRPGEVEFVTAQGRTRFAVEVAASPEARQHGLMNRKSLPAGAGMLFVFPEPLEARFWMKDTLIPLDMIFLDPTGTVLDVAADARPMDESVIDGGPGVLYVLEVNAGLARRFGIGPGARMRGTGINQAIAAWPCSAP